MPLPPPKNSDASDASDAQPPAPSDLQRLAQLLTSVARGTSSVETALADLASRLGSPPATTGLPPIDGVTLDLDRQRRCGYPEVIYGQGKPAAMVAEIMRVQLESGQAALATRVGERDAELVRAALPQARYNPIARTLSAGGHAAQPPRPLAAPPPNDQPPNPPRPDESQAEGTRAAATAPGAGPHVAVVTAGSTDAPVAEEAIETLHWMGIPFRRFEDIGVAGPARLLNAVPQLRQATAVVVIAGMEGALPAAVAGHLSVPVFAVPTSVGYGATLGGLTPLMGMLSSCASNVAVVNIDAGFKAAYLSGLIVKPLTPASATTHAPGAPGESR